MTLLALKNEGDPKTSSGPLIGSRVTANVTPNAQLNSKLLPLNSIVKNSETISGFGDRDSAVAAMSELRKNSITELPEGKSKDDVTMGGLSFPRLQLAHAVLSVSASARSMDKEEQYKEAK